MIFLMPVDAYLYRVGRNIKAARERRGLRQIDVEDKIGLSYRHYQKIEAGQVNVTVGTLYDLARLFRVRVEDLVRE